MKKILWVIIPLLTLLSFPARAQYEDEPIEVPAAVVNSMTILHPFFPAGEWQYSFAPRQVGGFDTYAISEHSAITWTYYPTLIYDLEDLDEIVDQAWVNVIIHNYDNTKTIERCIVDDTYLFYDIVGFSNGEDYTMHYWVWIDDTGWNEFFAAITFDDQEPLFAFEEDYFEVTAACVEPDKT